MEKGKIEFDDPGFRPVNQAAIKLLDDWLQGDAGDQAEAWEQIKNSRDTERLAQIQQFEILAKCLEDGDITSVLEWLRAAVKLLEKSSTEGR